MSLRYALLGLLASAGLTQDDVNIQSVGPTGVWEFVATGKSVGMAGVPDWIPPVQAAGVKVKVIPSDEYFPHMAQGIAASDQIIKEKPEMVRKFVHAALRGMKDIMDDPEKESDISCASCQSGRERKGRLNSHSTCMRSLSIRGSRSWARSTPSGSPNCRTST